MTNDITFQSRRLSERSPAGVRLAPQVRDRHSGRHADNAADRSRGNRRARRVVSPRVRS
jgi:hypothetical protein